MMGTRLRSFAPLPRDVSLEELVPQVNFYRRLEATLDLSFVRELVEPLYGKGGRPSVDPVVFFKLQLVMFFEDLRSERRLMRTVSDRLSVRWYLGYDLFEPVPDHSSLARICERFGLGVIRSFFERIVQECLAAGLVWSEELYFDATKVEANASIDSTRSCSGAVWRSTWRRPSPKRPSPFRKKTSRESSLASWDRGLTRPSKPICQVFGTPLLTTGCTNNPLGGCVVPS